VKLNITAVCLTSILTFSFSLFAQPNPFVLSDPNNPSCVPHTEIDEALLEDIIEKKAIDKRRRIGSNNYTIPVVFHIIHKEGVENISDAQVYSALDILNKDFNGGNSDLTQVPDPFAEIIGNGSIHFALAKQAPDGTCTNGINRYLSGYDDTYSYFWTDDGQYYLNTIKAAHYWDTDKYLNVYVVNQSYNSGLAYFPYQVEARPNAEKWLDGIMMRHYNLGNIGTAKHNSLTHTFAHEVGHYLDLMHIWGNWFYPGSSRLSWKDDCLYDDNRCPDFYCHSDDLVNDTPNTEYYFEGCIYQSNTCGSADNATNIMGYGCELMFTQGQVTRMHRTLNSSLANRNNLWSTANLEYTLNCSGIPAETNCKKLYNSFVQDFSIVSDNTGYLRHYLGGIKNKVRYRIDGGSWVEFESSDIYYYTVNQIEACATYEFQISEQCDTIFSPWSSSKFFYTNDAAIPEINQIAPIDSLACFGNDTLSNPQDCSYFKLLFELNNQTYLNTANGVAQALPYGGTPPYEYEWSTGEESALINGLSPGFYVVSVTDSLGCMLNDSIQILAVNCDDFHVELSSTNEYYFEGNDGTAFAEISGGLTPYKYNWSNGDSIASLYNLSPGSYSVQVEDAQGCTALDSILIEGIDCSLLDLNIEVSHQTYYGVNDGSILIEVIGGTAPFANNWSNGDSISFIQNLAPATYNLLVTDALECELNVSVQIDSVDCKHLSMEIYTEDASSPQAEDGLAMTTVNGGNPPYQYLWSTGDTVSVLDSLATGNYTLTVRDSIGCPIIENVLINSPVCDSIHLNFISSDETYFEAHDGSAMVVATGGFEPYNYLWSTGDSVNTLVNLMPDEYWVKVTDTLGCFALDTIIVDSVDCNNLDIDINSSHETYFDANDGNILIEVSGGNPPYQYIWSTGDSTAQINNLPPDTYYLSLIDQLGCNLQDSITIKAVDCSTLEVSVETSDETYSDGNDGSAAIFILGVQAPYQYLWSSGDTISQLNNLAPGIYTFQVIDGVGCVLEDSIQIKSVQCSMLSVDVIEKQITCADGKDGSLFIAGVQHANEPYTINWSNGSSAYLNNNLSAGVYTLSLMDDLGCTFLQEFIMEDGAQISMTEVISPASSFQSPDASIDITVYGGVAPYQFFWSTGTLDEDISNVFAGTYWLSITDSLNCHISITNIEVPVGESCPNTVVETPASFTNSNIVQAKDNIQSNRIVQTGEALHYSAGQIISLENDFHILKGGVFEAVIEDCGDE